tara:strand:- start:1332 stop:2102 length:771 start_codon:yes stop_codon:yes gene_type:complete
MKGHKRLKEFYDHNFYHKVNHMSLESAEIYAKYLTYYYKPTSVLDLGCGTGAWLKAFKDCGSKQLKGMDGDWIKKDDLLDSEVAFDPINLNELELSEEKFDLAMSLEVAEHLEESSANNFVDYLTNSSDIVLFGSAYENQGGTNHINEQKHSYWAKKFVNKGFLPFDFFREKFWDDSKVGFWYRQNIFLYIKDGSEPHSLFSEQGFSPITNIFFMDCVHPELYQAKCAEGISFTTHLNGIVPSFIRAIKRRIKGKK